MYGAKLSPAGNGEGWWVGSRLGVHRAGNTARVDLTPEPHTLLPSEHCLPTPISSGPPAPRHLRAQALSDSEIQLTWQRPEASIGPISKYIVEVQVAGGSGDPLWMDVDRPEETSTIVRGLNASTRYLFRVRASIQGPGDWSSVAEESTLGNGERAQPRGLPARGRSPCPLLAPDLQFWSQDIRGPSQQVTSVLILAPLTLPCICCPSAGKTPSPQ